MIALVEFERNTGKPSASGAVDRNWWENNCVILSSTGKQNKWLLYFSGSIKLSAFGAVGRISIRKRKTAYLEIFEQ